MKGNTKKKLGNLIIIEKLMKARTRMLLAMLLALLSITTARADDKTIYARVVQYYTDGNAGAIKKKVITGNYKVSFHAWTQIEVHTTEGTWVPLKGSDENLSQGFDQSKFYEPKTVNNDLGDWCSFTYSDVKPYQRTLTGDEELTLRGDTTKQTFHKGDIVYHRYKFIIALWNTTKDSEGKYRLLYQTKDLEDFAQLTTDKTFFEVSVREMTSTSTDAGYSGTSYSLNEMNEYQAKMGLSANLTAYLCGENDADTLAFSPVRDQTVINGKYDDGTVLPVVGHAMNNTLYALGVNRETMASKFGKFYVKLGYWSTADGTSTFTPLRYYYPKWESVDDSLNQQEGWAYTTDGTGSHVSYGECETTDLPANHTFFTLGSDADEANDASYTIYLNTSDIIDGYYQTNQNAQMDYTQNNNMSVPYHRTYGKNSVAVTRHRSIADDKNGIYFMSNMVNITPENSNFQSQESVNSKWDPTDTSRPMTKLSDASGVKAQYAANFKALKDEGFAKDGDIVYLYRVIKPATNYESMFFAFRKGSYTGDNDDTWNKGTIRPDVQEGKTAMGLHGCVFVAGDRGQSNAMEAITPALSNDKHTKFIVYLNLTQATYTIEPEESYGLTGAAVTYWDEVHRSWNESTGADAWGNGNYNNGYSVMAYNPKDNCYQWTGKFKKSICVSENGQSSNPDMGFRFITNGLFTKNYHEEIFWQTSQNWSANVQALYHHTLNAAKKENSDAIVANDTLYQDYVNAQKAISTSSAIITQRPILDNTQTYPDGTHVVAVPGWVNVDGSHNPNGPDTYTYNHVQLDILDTKDNGNNGYELAKKKTHYLYNVKQGKDTTATDEHPTAATVRDENAKVNLNWDLPEGIYTIKFYPQGDETGKPYYTIEPATDTCTKIPEVHSYSYMRTYSSSVTYARPDGLDVYIATKKDANSPVVFRNINALGFLPANVGLLIGYTDETNTKINTGADGYENTEFIFDSEASSKYYHAVGKAAPRLELDRWHGPVEAVKAAQKKYKYVDDGGTEGNLLKPATYVNMTTGNIDNITKVWPTEYTDGTTEWTTGKSVKYRNYMVIVRATDVKNANATNVEDKYNWALGFGRIKIFSTETLNNLQAGRAWLQLPADISGGTTATTGNDQNSTSVTGAKAENAIFEGEEETAAIKDVRTPSSTTSPADAYYTLQGTKVAHPTQRGVYIHNGKKVVIK